MGFLDKITSKLSSALERKIYSPRPADEEGGGASQEPEAPSEPVTATGAPSYYLKGIPGFEAPYSKIRYRFSNGAPCFPVFINTVPGSPLIEPDERAKHPDDRLPLNTKDLNSHAIIFGQSGSGKTFAFLNQVYEEYFINFHLKRGPEREARKFAAFVVDPKGEFADKTWVLSKKYGRMDDVIFFGPTHCDAVFDPFGDPDENPFQRANKLQAMSDAMSDGAKSNDPFWPQASQKFFTNTFWLYEKVKIYDPSTPPMDFRLLNLLSMDKGQPLNGGEIASSRERINVLVKTVNELCIACVSTVSQACLAIGEGNRRYAEFIQTYKTLMASAAKILNNQVTVPPDTPNFYGQPVTPALLRGMTQLGRLLSGLQKSGFNSEQTIEGNLAQQLEYVKAAYYTFTSSDNDNEKRTNENIIRNQAVAIMDFVYDQLKQITPDACGRELYDALQAYHTGASAVERAFKEALGVRPPEEQIGTLKRYLNTYEKSLKEQGIQPQDDPIFQYFMQEHLNPANDKTSGSVSMVATNMCNLFLHPPFSNMFNSKPTFDWKRVVDEGLIVVMDMNFSANGAAANLACIMLKCDFYRTVLARKNLRMTDRKTGEKRKMNLDREVLYLIDEFQAAVTSGTVGEAKLLDRVREYKCSCVFGTQSIASIRNALPKDAEVDSILTNLSVKGFYTNSDKGTNEFASNLFGEAAQVTGAINSTAEQLFAQQRDIGQTGATQNMQEVQRFKPSAFATLRMFECIVRLPQRFGRRKMSVKTFMAGRPLPDPAPDIPIPEVLEPPKPPKKQRKTVTASAARMGQAPQTAGPVPLPDVEDDDNFTDESDAALDGGVWPEDETG